MICPFCDHTNIDGVDLCLQCHASLADLRGNDDAHGLEHALLHQPLSELIADNHDYVEIAPDLTLGEAVVKLNESRRHCAVVVSEGTVVGILTERDLLGKVANRFGECAGEPVSVFMTPDPATLHSDDAIAFGLNQMMVGGYRHIPIVDDHRLVGMVSVRDILGAVAGHAEAAA